jgi:hypothetical protein
MILRKRSAHDTLYDGFVVTLPDHVSLDDVLLSAAFQRLGRN